MSNEKNTSDNHQGHAPLAGVGSSYFDLSLTYIKGDLAILGGITYIFDPHEKQQQFSIGYFPTEGYGWRIA